MKTITATNEIKKIVNTDHYDPFTVLGAHHVERKGRKGVAICAFLPDAVRAEVLELQDGVEIQTHVMAKVANEGFFELYVPDRSIVFPYKLRRFSDSGESETFYDSYSFLPTLTEFDLYLFNAGDHHRIYEKLGAHYAEVNGVGGIQFAVWAPGARSVSVIGSFNGWDRRKHAMRVLGSSGVWEIFIPGLPEGEFYKFQVKTPDGNILDKSDPYGFEMELRPSTASRVNLLRGFEWRDDEWIKNRSSSDPFSKPISIYEVHLGSWARMPEEGNRWLTYRELAHQIVDHVAARGFTHIELLPIMEHPFDASWGYQVTGYFAPTSRFGRPQDFMYFVDYCHQHNIGVLLDWVPAHFPKDQHALGTFDGTHLYEHADPRKGEHQDWGTYIFNYGRHEVRNFLVSNALYWLDRFHIDGLRIDAVASMLYLDYSRRHGEWLPNQYGGRENIDAISFLKQCNGVVHHYFPGSLMIAEESTAWPGVTTSQQYGGLGFDLKWNMGWMHDMISFIEKDPIHRRYHFGQLTFALLYAFHENFVLPFSHDEVVHLKRSMLDKMPGDLWGKFANLRLLYAYMYAHPGKKLLFMGEEFAQWEEWNHDRSLDWDLLRWDTHQGVQRFVRDLNRLYREVPALHEVDFRPEGFEWIDFRDVDNSVVSFLRRGKDPDDAVVCVFNFTPAPREKYRVGVPWPGRYREALNSDAAAYGGSNAGNGGSIAAESVPWMGRPHSVSLTLPPLGALFLLPER